MSSTFFFFSFTLLITIKYVFSNESHTHSAEKKHSVLDIIMRPPEIPVLTSEHFQERSLTQGSDCSRALETILKDFSGEKNVSRLSFLHFTKAGGTNIEWILTRESLARRYQKIDKKRYLYSNEDDISALPRASHFMTILRELVSRFASYVHFRRFDTIEKFRKHGTNLEWTAKTYSNIYTRRLLHIASGKARHHLTVKRCAAALRVLQTKFALVGTTERLLETVALMGYIFRFESFPIFGRVNQQIGSPGVSDLSKFILRHVKKLNKCDAKLHEVANTMLDQTIKCVGSDFQTYFESFKYIQKNFTLHNPGCIETCVNYGERHRTGNPIRN